MTKINYSNVKSIPIDAIKPNPFQVRKIDPLDVRELAEDIKVNGLLQPPQARRVKGVDGQQVTFELAYGHRRHMAYRILATEDPEHFGFMPIIESKLSDEEMAMMAWSENEVRKQLNPIERAEAVKRMVDQFEWTQQEVADKLHLDRSTVANLIRMLRMPAEVLDGVANGTLPQRAAMALLPWYELTPIEMAVVEQKNPEAAEFVSLARGGQIQSDVIRKRMEEYLGEKKEEETTPSSLPLKGEEENGEEIPMTIEERTDEGEDGVAVGGFEPEESDTPEDLTFQREKAEEDAPELLATSEEVKPAAPVNRDGVKPASGNVPPPTPAPAPEPPANTTLFTITWYENGSVIAGLRAPGKAPVTKFLPVLTDDSIPDLLRTLREQIGG
jgi:ParB family chromosome partitioning protein